MAQRIRVEECLEVYHHKERDMVRLRRIVAQI